MSLTPTTRREKPVFRHALIMGALAVTVGVFLFMKYSWDMVATSSYLILKFSGVDVSYSSYKGPVAWINFMTVSGTLAPISVKLPEGVVAQFYVLLECSGILTVGVFAAIATFTIGLLKGSLLRKIGWFILSIGVGLLWNLNRVTLAIFVAYNFGLQAFSLVHFLLAPFIDFVWVVSMWALGMSILREHGGEAA